MIENAQPQQAAPKWTIGNFVLLVVCWLGGAFASGVVLVVMGADFGNLTPIDVSISIVGQNLGALSYLYYLSTRRGTSNWGLDFGFRPFPFPFLALLLGAGLQIFLGIVTILLVPEDALEQGIADAIAGSTGLGTRLLVGFLTVILTPVVEELMFRGVLLSWLVRHMAAWPAIVVSAVIFAVAHYGDANLWVLPGLAVVGIVLAWVTVKDGSLRRAMPIHMGFNLVGVVALFAELG